MVKNTQGGSKHKSQARKNANPNVSNNIRYPQEDGECFAKVVKMLGNGMCSVNLVYNDQLYSNIVCHIRGKFRSKNKKNNFVSIGSTLLVGLRTWSSNINACDLLDIYNDIHLSNINLPYSLSAQPNFNHDSFVFSNNSHSDNTLFHNNLSIIDDNIIHHNHDIDFDHI